MQASHIIGRLAYTAGAANAHGNPSATYAAAVDVAAYAIYSESLTEPQETARSTVDDRIVALLPSGSGFAAKDRATWQGKTYEVVGGVESLDHGPFGYEPGEKVTLRRVSG